MKRVLLFCLLIPGLALAQNFVGTTGSLAGQGSLQFASQRPPAFLGSILTRDAGPGQADPMVLRGLRDLVAEVEAGPAGYNAVVLSAVIKPPKRPTEMTLRDVFAWIDATPGQNHAIGRYQFIPTTLDYLVRRTKTPLSARFSPALQDRFADILLHQAGAGEVSFGRISNDLFLDQLAQVWAALPMRDGRSAYHGVGRNKALMSRAEYRARVAAILG
ncbi:hypothetical protein FHS89_000511 [Rubricella aquisinus]|uniref:Uncharacterized protein n=1 Tax=Rubricella aquisinus TaxID=2028108 RepID=A0A840WK11_9RHOB|nr:hypothetical protein [Rubricella aquisinus]MBB5514513.1 hypothetical protein [Rubricella aquisinus]